MRISGIYTARERNETVWLSSHFSGPKLSFSVVDRMRTLERKYHRTSNITSFFSYISSRYDSRRSIQRYFGVTYSDNLTYIFLFLSLYTNEGGYHKR
jgi:hypothetical protein